MKNYRITVNGTAYDVAVEELGAGAAPAAAAPVAAPAGHSGTGRSTGSCSKHRRRKHCSNLSNAW